MSPKSQQLAIATVYGYHEEYVHGNGMDCDVWVGPDNLCVARLPDYLTDLNAMHEAEKVLTAQQWDDYTDELSRICGCDGWEIMDTDQRKRMVSGTAPQRAEALLRALNLWDTTK